jgi:hypothetical protein
MSVSSSNSTVTADRPNWEMERTSATSGRPFMVVSMGKLTRRSTSYGE